MPIGTSDGEYFETETDAALAEANGNKDLSYGNNPLKITVTKQPRNDTPIPSAVRLFADTVTGNTEDIDESYFTQPELNNLYGVADRQLAKGNNVIGYGDYGEKDPWAEGTQAVINTLTDPAQSLAFSLGMAKVRKEDDGTIVIDDNYHWAASKEKVDALKKEGATAIARKLFEGAVDNGLLGPLNVIGNLAAPSGHGRKVSIRIPPPKADLSWVDDPSTFDKAAARTKQSVKQRKEGTLTKLHEALGNIPIDTIKKMKNFTEGVMNMRPGESFEDYPELATAGASIAFDLMGVGMSTMPLKAGVGLFGGRYSKQAVDTATKLEKEGLSPQTVKDLTGLERGAEGKWRREFSDKDARILDNGFLPVENSDYKVGLLKDVFKHDELYRVYPEIGDMLIVIDPKKKSGATFYGAKNTMVVSEKAFEDTDRLRQTFLHEIQHWIQHKEGFAYGSDVKVSGLSAESKTAIKDYLANKYHEDTLKKAELALSKNETGEAERLLNYVNNELDYRLYQSIAGETEAFNVMNRSHMSAQDIRRSPATATEDIPRKEQIVLTGDKKTVPRYAEEYTPKPYSKDEKVVAPAIKLKDGRVITGEMETGHAGILFDNDLTDDMLKGAKDVFVTNAGRVVDRQQALNMAKHHKQLPKESASERTGGLMSEDLAGLEAMK